MRGMRLKKREIKDMEAIRELIDNCKVIRIGCQDEEGIFIVPVNYGYEFTVQENGNPKWKLYFHSAKQGRKADAFAKQETVALELDKEGGVIRGDYTCSYSYAYQSIMGTGKITKLISCEEKRYGFEKIMEHLAPEAEVNFDGKMLEATDLYCIEVLSFRGKERKAKGTGKNQNV